MNNFILLRFKQFFIFKPFVLLFTLVINKLIIFNVYFFVNTSLTFVWFFFPLATTDQSSQSVEECSSRFIFKYCIWFFSYTLAPDIRHRVASPVILASSSSTGVPRTGFQTLLFMFGTCNILVTLWTWSVYR